MPSKQYGYRNFTLAAMFAALIILLTFTPIGYIPLGFVKATIIHIPVIMGAVFLGPKYGAGLGALFGLTSLIVNTYTPALLSFAFSPMIPVPGLMRGSPFALLVAFVPRILVGVIPYYVWRIMDKILGDDKAYISLFVTGLSGGLTNTLLVMHLIYFLFNDAYAAVREIPADAVYKAVLVVIGTNGVPESIVAGLITAAVGVVLMRVYGKRVADVAAPEEE